MRITCTIEQHHYYLTAVTFTIKGKGQVQKMQLGCYKWVRCCFSLSTIRT